MSLTDDDERDARVAKELIEAAGGHAAEAARIAEAIKKPGPTVLEAMTEHLQRQARHGRQRLQARRRLQRRADGGRLRARGVRRRRRLLRRALTRSGAAARHVHGA